MSWNRCQLRAPVAGHGRTAVGVGIERQNQRAIGEWHHQLRSSRRLLGTGPPRGCRPRSAPPGWRTCRRLRRRRPPGSASCAIIWLTTLTSTVIPRSLKLQCGYCRSDPQVAQADRLAVAVGPEQVGTAFVEAGVRFLGPATPFPFCPPPLPYGPRGAPHGVEQLHPRRRAAGAQCVQVVPLEQAVAGRAAITPTSSPLPVFTACAAEPGPILHVLPRGLAEHPAMVALTLTILGASRPRRMPARARAICCARATRRC